MNPPPGKFKLQDKVDVIDLRDGATVERGATIVERDFEQPAGYPAPQWFCTVECAGGLKFSCAEKCLLPAKEVCS